MYSCSDSVNSTVLHTRDMHDYFYILVPILAVYIQEQRILSLFWDKKQWKGECLHLKIYSTSGSILINKLRIMSTNIILSKNV